MNPRTLRPGERRMVRRGIYAYKTQEGRVHYGISYYANGRPHKEIVGPTLRGAEKALAVRKAEVAQGRFKLATRKRSPHFGAFSVQYLDYAKANKKSWQTDEFLLRRLGPAFNAKRLSEITPWSIEQYKAARRAAVSPRTVNIELSLLRRMLNLALAWGVLDRSPSHDVRMIRETERPMRVLSPTEEEKLSAFLPVHLQDVMAFALHTGLRRGEILSLRWFRVDTDTVTVGESKTGRVRRVPLNAVARDVLARQPKKNDYVFTWHGAPYTRFDKTWRLAVQNAGIPPIRFHDLRHTFATRLILAGEDISVVQELLGHASILMTRRYAHPSPEHRKAAVGKLEGFRTSTKPARRRKRHRVKIEARF